MKILLRDFVKEDRSQIAEILSRIKVFNDEDVALAIELIDTSLEHPKQKDYCFNVATDEDERVIGYACYGSTPLTDGVYDLYWIAVDPEWAGQGVGTLILRDVEDRVRRENGRMIVIETSSSLDYGSTRKFYLKNDYKLVETIRDFYRIGEDRVTYLKNLPRRT
jgi:ribosomal protein S18 acetylase RimI-like enzyme